VARKRAKKGAKKARRKRPARSKPPKPAPNFITARARRPRFARSKADTQALQTAAEVLARYRERLMQIPGVKGAEVTRKVRGGKVLDTIGITVLVARKVAKDALPPGQEVPAEIENIPVDVQPVGFKTTACAAVAASLRRARPALVGGVSIGDPSIGSMATLALMARAADQEVFVGITAGHAVSGGAVVTQPAGGNAAQAVGQVIDAEVSDQMDAAVFQIDPDRRTFAGGVAGVGGPLKIGAVASAQDYVPVLMVGACSGWVYGQARRIAGPVQVDYGQGPTDMADQILVYPVPSGRAFNLSGDSGAMLLSADGTEALGVIIAALFDEPSGTGVGLATPIDRILGRFGLRVLPARV
jgi:hypothetical protein